MITGHASLSLLDLFQAEQQNMWPPILGEEGLFAALSMTDMHPLLSPQRADMELGALESHRTLCKGSS